jgi:hypothetical protein
MDKSLSLNLDTSGPERRRFGRKCQFSLGLLLYPGRVAGLPVPLHMLAA